MRRETLVDFFESFATYTDEFLVYFDGYRTRSYTYAEVAAAARVFAARLRGAGLQQGDVIVEVDGQEVSGANDLTSILADHDPSDRVTVTVDRAGKTFSYDVKLGKK